MSPLYDYWRDPDGAYLVMCLMKGGNLADMIKKKGALPLTQVAHIIEQITFALATAHRRDNLRRDFRPASFLFDKDGNAYLSDFGIAEV